MARGNGRSNASDDWRRRMHTVELSRNEEKACVEFYSKSKASVSDILVKFVEAGWKFSASYSEFYGTVFVSVTCQREELPYYKHTYTLRHSEVIPGILILAWAIDDRDQKGTLLEDGVMNEGRYLEIPF